MIKAGSERLFRRYFSNLNIQYVYSTLHVCTPLAKFHRHLDIGSATNSGASLAPLVINNLAMARFPNMTAMSKGVKP